MDKTLQLVVKEIETITSTVKRFVLRPNGGRLPAFGPGAHLRIHLPMGARHYSLLNNPLQSIDEYEIAVKRIESLNSGSSFLHDGVSVGDTLSISQPENHFPLQLKARHHLFYAAGIGITPILSMMSYLKAIGRSFELHYVAQSSEECAFFEQISHEFSEQTTFYFMERSERMKRLKQSLVGHQVGTHMYMCGPQAFMDELEAYASEIGFPRHAIHSERFTSPQEGRNNKPFKVYLPELERTLKVEADKSLLQTLEAHGIKVPYACRMGICGTCEVSVIDGEIEHVDTFLTEKERESNMLCCVSRGIGCISIDL